MLLLGQAELLGPVVKSLCGVRPGCGNSLVLPSCLHLPQQTQLWPSLGSWARLPPCLSLRKSCSRSREVTGTVSSARGFEVVEGSLAVGVMLPSSSASCPEAELLWGCGAAVLAGDPQEADPVFPPTKSTPCVQPGVTGKAGCSPEGGDGAAACRAAAASCRSRCLRYLCRPRRRLLFRSLGNDVWCS